MLAFRRTRQRCSLKGGFEIPGSISVIANSEPLDFGHNLFRFRACDALPSVALIQLQTQSMMLLMLPQSAQLLTP